MPPFPFWFQGQAYIQAFFAHLIFAGDASNRWQLEAVTANDQPAFALYQRNEATGVYDIFCLEVLTVEAECITRLDHFMMQHATLDGEIESRWFRFFNLPRHRS